MSKLLRKNQFLELVRRSEELVRTFVVATKHKLFRISNRSFVKKALIQIKYMHNKVKSRYNKFMLYHFSYGLKDQP